MTLPSPSVEDSPPRKRKRRKARHKGRLARVRIYLPSVLHTQLTHAFRSRTIRALPEHNAVVTKGLAPPRQVDKCVRTSLNAENLSASTRITSRPSAAKITVPRKNFRSNVPSEFHIFECTCASSQLGVELISVVRDLPVLRPRIRRT